MNSWGLQSIIPSSKLKMVKFDENSEQKMWCTIQRKKMNAWKSSPQSNSNASDGTQIWVHSRYHWTNFWFRSLRNLFSWSHLLFAYLVWTYDSQMLVILRFCIFSCIFESWQTRCQLQNSHKLEIYREIAPQPNAYFGDLHYRKIFLPTGRSFNQVQRSWLYFLRV